MSLNKLNTRMFLDVWLGMLFYFAVSRKIGEVILGGGLREKLFGTCDGKDVVRARWGRRRGLRKEVDRILGFGVDEMR